MKTLSALCALLALVLTSCISDSSSPDLEKSSGVVLSYPPERVWEETKATFMQIGQITHLDEGDKLIDAAIGPDAVVLAIIDSYDRSSTKTILRISARKGDVETPEVASQVLSQIQERLLGRL